MDQTENRDPGPNPDFSPVKGLEVSSIRALVGEILRKATLDEKVAMMSGRGFFQAFVEDQGLWGARPYQAGGGIERLRVPAFMFSDGPRGVARGQSTCFPCSMARGASFDVHLEYRIGEIMGKELRAQGCNLSGAVSINLLRNPAWGRAQETYGEDSHHLGEMGKALMLGIQSHNVCATVKHFALNSIENSRFKVDVRVDDRTLREIYLPHFHKVISAGVGSVMSSYNKVNGEYAGQNRMLLTDMLRHEWGFEGFVHSDWLFGVRQVYGPSAGLDVENPEPLVLGDKLKAAVNAGAVEPQVIDQACRRILTTLYRFACAEDPLPSYPAELVASPAHVATALEAAEKSAVLLENNGVLPLNKMSARRLAVLGRLARETNTGDNGSSRVRAPYVVTPLDGLRGYLDKSEILTGDEADLEHAKTVASEADAAIVVVGYTAEEEGEYLPRDFMMGHGLDQQSVLDNLPLEMRDGVGQTGRTKDIGGDRASLGLPDDQVALIRAAASTRTPVIVVIVGGSAVLVEEWRESAAAILQTFYAGMEGGTALARILFGEVSPSGRLPFTVALRPEDYPYFDNDADSITYDYWHGYAKFEREDTRPRYAFGHGMGYSHFTYRALAVRNDGHSLAVTVTVCNSGIMNADHSVLCFVRFPGSVQPRANRSLKAFSRVSLSAGQTQSLHFRIPINELEYWDHDTGHWRVEPGSYELSIADGLGDPSPLRASVRL